MLPGSIGSRKWRAASPSVSTAIVSLSSGSPAAGSF